jgi:hypothetical protein
MSKQKICVISFDNWNYDNHIVKALQKKGIESFHIKIGSFKHKNNWSRIQNTFCKIFLNKNPKIINRQYYILERLKQVGIQDQILVINPELISKECHLEIQKHTLKYIAYLYDSVKRNPVEHLLSEIFDEIYSFDKEDIAQYGFKETTNYNYVDTSLYLTKNSIKNKVVYIASFDKRMAKLHGFSEQLKRLNISYCFIIAGKKAMVYNLKKLFSKKLQSLEFSRKSINQKELHQLYLESDVIIDLVRDNQTGLSFRVFEAMAFEKKIITNNQNIKNYNFYNPKNILVIGDHFEFEKSFFETPYEAIPSDIFKQYTLDSWVETIFELKN